MNAALQGYLAAIEETLAAGGALSEAAGQTAAVAELVDGSAELTLVVADGALPVATRRAVLDDLLRGRVRDEVSRLVHQAVTVVPAAELTSSFHWLHTKLLEAAERARAGSGAPQEEPAAGRLGSRNRIWGYAAAVFETVSTGELEQIEDEIFRFARTVENNRSLRAAFSDRDLPVAERQGLAADLLAGKVTEATGRLVAYAVRGGRARDFVVMLDSLVEAAAAARGWRVAKVRSAEAVADDQRQELGAALATMAGHPVELQVMTDPRLLAGAVVELGDLLVDASIRHRLEQLGEQLAHLGPGPATRFTRPTAGEERRR